MGEASDLCYWSGQRVATAIRQGGLRCREYLESLLDRIGRLDPALNAVVTVDAEGARREADAADEAVKRGRPLGPLHGVCMTVKDSFQTAGMRTTSGALDFAEFVPEVDALPVARLRAAGAVIFGKTNLPTYAADAQSYNELFGQSNNPWNLERTVGGSSGGAAAALAAGFTPIELGSDIGGSIRGPAATCGVCGHKPSFGIVPAIGHIPGPPGTLTQADLAVTGPMARDAGDLEWVLDVLAGPDSWYEAAWRLQLPPPRATSLRDYRIAAWLDDPACSIDRELRSVLEGVAETLKSEGAQVDLEARPEFAFDYATATFRDLLAAALSGAHTPERIEQMAGAEGEGEVSIERRRRALRHRSWLSINERRLQLRQRWHDFFKRWDVILLPVLPTAAIPHDHSEPQTARRITINGASRPYWDQLQWVGLTGVAYLPATVVPVGATSEGLPVGIQIAGPFLEDRTTLDLGRRLREVLGDFVRPPGY